MKLVKAVLACNIILALALCAAPGLARAEKTIVLKVATYHPVAHYLTDDAFKLWGQEIEKRTNGKVKFKWFLAGSLAKSTQMYSAVESGLADVAFAATWAVIHKMPITSWLELPFLVESSRQSADVAWDMYQQIPEMQKEYKSVKVLGFFNTAVCQISTLSPPVKTIADLKGKRIATPSPTGVKALQLLGATPQSMISADMYMAVHRNMIDGVMFPFAPLRSFKLTDLLANHTICSVQSATHAIIMNKRVWKKLPKDVQKVFDELRQSAGSLCGETLTNESAWVLQDLKARGDKVYYLPDGERDLWKEKVKPMYSAWVENVNERGMDGKALFEKISKIAQYRKEHPYPPASWWGNAGKKRTH